MERIVQCLNESNVSHNLYTQILITEDRQLITNNFKKFSFCYLKDLGVLSEGKLDRKKMEEYIFKKGGKASLKSCLDVNQPSTLEDTATEWFLCIVKSLKM